MLKQPTIYNSHEEKSPLQASKYTQSNHSLYRYLAYRDLPTIFQKHDLKPNALDYGAGTGISTQFLQNQGFTVTGVDTSKEMLAQAQVHCPSVPFHIVKNGVLPFSNETFDFIFSSFVLFELASKKDILAYLKEAKRTLKKDGTAVILTGSEQMYSKDWILFDTNYPENKTLKSGNKVRVFSPDANIEFTDYYWTENDYHAMFKESGFVLIEAHYPKGKLDEPYPWKDELECSPFAIFVAKQSH